jgi:nucleoside-diphosphate-sugar epimerase
LGHSIAEAEFWRRAAGFIGFGLTRRLLEDGRPVGGIDNVNSYYNPALKEARLAVRISPVIKA